MNEDEELVERIMPPLASRVKLHDKEFPIFEEYGVQTEIDKALKSKVWLKSGGSIVINQTEALVAIDVNSGKMASEKGVEATATKSNLEAAVEVGRQLRLRDLAGLIVIDFIDMEIRENRRKVLESFKDALSRDKTRTQVFEISELGLVEMTRKRIGEGLLTNFADPCVTCEGRGVMIDLSMLD